MRLSIRQRLVLSTGATIALVVTLVALFVWWRMSRALLAGLDETLASEALALSGQLEEDGEYLQFELDSPLMAAKAGSEVLVQVVTADGRSLYRSPALHDADLFPKWPVGEDTLVKWQYVEPTAHRSYRAVALCAAVKAADEPAPREDTGAGAVHAWVLVARPLAPLQRTLNSLTWTLAGAGLFALIATFLGAHYVASQGIRPIRWVAQVIGNARPMQSELEIDARRVPHELDPIIAKTNELLARVQHELKRQRQLTADVAHDLRTPVAGVRTLLDVCLRQDRSSAEYVEAVATALAALRQLSALLDDVLTLARLDADAEQVLPGRVSIAEVIHQAVDSVRPLALSRGVEIDVADLDGRAIVTDRGKLVKVLANLVANAVEYQTSGASVAIVVEHGPTSIGIHVRDQGPGIPAELRERIFDRFFRADPARARDAHNGLGLPIARGLARLLGGDIVIESVAGGGSDFIVTLPQEPSPARPAMALAQGR